MTGRVARSEQERELWKAVYRIAKLKPCFLILKCAGIMALSNVYSGVQFCSIHLISYLLSELCISEDCHVTGLMTGNHHSEVDHNHTRNGCSIIICHCL